MKIYAVYNYRSNGDKADIVDKAQDFSDVGRLYKKHVIEIADFAALQLATSKNPQTNVTAEERDFYFHAFRKGDVCTILVATKDYPSRTAFSILREVMNEYDQYGGNFPGGKSQSIQKAITAYQDPKNADKLAAIHQNLDETKEIMVTNLEKAIGRGESLEELAQRSENISAQSKIFAREARDLNRCCSII